MLQVAFELDHLLLYFILFYPFWIGSLDKHLLYIRSHLWSMGETHWKCYARPWCVGSHLWLRRNSSSKFGEGRSCLALQALALCIFLLSCASWPLVHLWSSLTPSLIIFAPGRSPCPSAHKEGHGRSQRSRSALPGPDGVQTLWSTDGAIPLLWQKPLESLESLSGVEVTSENLTVAATAATGTGDTFGVIRVKVCAEMVSSRCLCLQCLVCICSSSFQVLSSTTPLLPFPTLQLCNYTSTCLASYVQSGYSICTLTLSSQIQPSCLACLLRSSFPRAWQMVHSFQWKRDKKGLLLPLQGNSQAPLSTPWHQRKTCLSAVCNRCLDIGKVS